MDVEYTTGGDISVRLKSTENARSFHIIERAYEHTPVTFALEDVMSQVAGIIAERILGGPQRRGVNSLSGRG